MIPPEVIGGLAVGQALLLMLGRAEIVGLKPWWADPVLAPARRGRLMPRRNEDDPLAVAVAALVVGFGALYFLGVAVALIPIYVPWWWAPLVGAAAGGIAGAILRRRSAHELAPAPADWRRWAGFTALAGAALLALALLVPSTRWLADYDRALRTKPAVELRAETRKARADYREERREYRRAGFGARPTYERPSRRWALTDAEKFNDVGGPVWRWVSAGLGALLLAGAVVARRMLGRAQPAQPPAVARAPQYGGLTSGPPPG